MKIAVISIIYLVRCILATTAKDNTDNITKNQLKTSEKGKKIPLKRNISSASTEILTEDIQSSHDISDDLISSQDEVFDEVFSSQEEFFENSTTSNEESSDVTSSTEEYSENMNNN